MRRHPAARRRTSRETRPQILFGVPRTCEKMHSAVQAVLAADPEQGEPSSTQRARGRRAGRRAPRRAARRCRPSSRAEYEQVDADDPAPGAPAARSRRPASRGDRRRRRSRSRSCSSSAALGVPLSEIYGMSETTRPDDLGRRSACKPGTVGSRDPGHGGAARRRRRGASCRGGNVFRGYLNDPERTAEALDADGWLHTGDIGELDDDGYLRIVDRKKELIITAGGKNISPANLEAALKAQPLIGQACVDRRRRGRSSPRCSCSTPTSRPRGRRATASTRHDAGRARARSRGAGRGRARGRRAPTSGSRRPSRSSEFTVLPDEWLPDSEELTPTMKLKRRGIAAKYADEIAALYDRSAGARLTAIATWSRSWPSLRASSSARPARATSSAASSACGG